MKLDDDVAVAVEQLRGRETLGFSEALNRLARAGAAVLSTATINQQFEVPTVDLGVMPDVSNIGEVLEILDADHDR